MRYRFSSFIAMFLAVWLLLTATYALAGPPALPVRAAVDVEVSAGPDRAPVRLHSDEFGAGKPIVLLHGLGGSGFSFRHIIPGLARDHRVITLDLKGFGASEKPFDDAYSAADQARLVVEFLRVRQLTDVVLVGHSYGGLVALIAAMDLNRREPSRLRRLVLLDAPAFPQPMPRAQNFLLLPIVPYVALAVVPPLLTSRQMMTTVRRLTPPATDYEAITYAEPLYEAGGRHALIASTRSMARDDSSWIVAGYRHIQQPALLIWCRFDPTVPLSSGLKLQSALPRARLHVLEHCDHAPAEEQPDDTVSLIRRFL